MNPDFSSAPAPGLFSFLSPCVCRSCRVPFDGFRTPLDQLKGSSTQNCAHRVKNSVMFIMVSIIHHSGSKYTWLGTLLLYGQYLNYVAGGYHRV
jgi:hypothetical protein